MNLDVLNNILESTHFKVTKNVMQKFNFNQDMKY